MSEPPRITSVDDHVLQTRHLWAARPSQRYRGGSPTVEAEKAHLNSGSEPAGEPSVVARGLERMGATARSEQRARAPAWLRQFDRRRSARVTTNLPSD